MMTSDHNDKTCAGRTKIFKSLAAYAVDMSTWYRAAPGSLEVGCMKILLDTQPVSTSAVHLDLENVEYVVVLCQSI